MEKITHDDLNKYIKKFIVSKSGNVSFLLTSNTEEEETKVSIQGKADSVSIGQMFSTFFIAMPEILPVFKHAIMYTEILIEEKKNEEKKEKIVEVMTGKLLM